MDWKINVGSRLRETRILISCGIRAGFYGHLVGTFMWVAERDMDSLV